MPLYRYKAASPDGEILEGEMEAVTQDAVIQRLQAQGHIPIRASEVAARTVKPERRWALEYHRLGAKEISLLTLELATLLEAGVTLDRALVILIQLAENRVARGVLGRLHEKIRRGSYLSDALEEEGGTFPRFYVNLVRAGEAGGALQATLSRLAEFMERAREVREAILSALIYPFILILLAIVSIIAILTFVVPRFAEMFADAGAALPWQTQIIITLGGFFERYWIGLMVAGAAVWVLIKHQLRDPRTRLWWDRIVLRLPLAGVLIAKYEAGRFVRTLGTLLASGIPLVDGMTIARAVVANQHIASGLAHVVDRIRDGQGLARPLAALKVFPALTGHMLQVGEETGQLEGMLLKLADIYDREVRTSLQRMVTVLEPLLILGLGMLVGGIIFSILVAVLGVNELAFI